MLRDACINHGLHGFTRIAKGKFPVLIRVTRGIFFLYKPTSN